MKEEEKKVDYSNEEQLQGYDSLDRLAMLELFNKQADDKAEIAFKRGERDRQVFELISGRKTSVFEEQQRLKKIIEDLPQLHEPKFKLFFPVLGKLANWTEEELKAYHKPPLAAKIINEVIYGRFPKDVLLHIHSKNPYIKWCTRTHKHYLFLSEDGILLLEKFIDDAITTMLDSSSIYDFRIKHAQKFGIAFQPVLFEKYLGLIAN